MKVRLNHTNKIKNIYQKRMNKRYKESNKLIQRALKVIPLGSQTFSKSIVQYPKGVSPLFISKGKGSHVWDVDNNEYIDFVNGLLSVMLGYLDADVDKSVLSQFNNGVSFSLPHILETEVAELLVEMVPCAEMVRFGKNGTDATSAAVRLARAFTGREHILVCGYHGWQDWYIGSTTRDLGVPSAVKELTHSFKYNDLNNLNAHFEKLKNKVACVIMEPMNFYYPNKDYLEQVKHLAHDNGALLVFDETVTGCRFSKGGAQEMFDVIPDLATFGKGMGNGFPISAVMGSQDVMMKMEDIFFSGTFGGETLSLAAAKAVLLKVRDSDVVENLRSKGELIVSSVTKCIERHDVGHIFDIVGHPSWSLLTIADQESYSSWEIKTFLFQEFFKRGVLFLGTHNISYAHTSEDITKLLDVYDEVFPIISELINNGNLVEFLEVDALKPVFKVRDV